MSSARISGRWIGALVLLAFVVVWLAGRELPDDSAVAPRSDARRAAEARKVDAFSPVAADAVSEQSAAIACQEQQISISANGGLQHLCLGRTQVVQNGNVRTFRADEQGGKGQWLRVDAAGETIVSVEVNESGQGNYACKWSKCAGVSIGPHDAQGARSIVFDKARLSRMKVVVDEAVDEFVALSGKLKTVPDDQLPATTCVGQLLYISVGAGTIHFCPDGGTGFDIEDDGGMTYRFTNADGGSVGVRMDRGGTLRRVEFGSFACNAPACAAVDIAPADADGRRKFAFRGTTLLERDGGAASAILNGNIVLAPQ
jgi:hypothetical protein